jgi:[ribosomal protein S18]-alanine N-acetyltransferase
MNTTGELTRLEGFHQEVFELDQEFFPLPWKKSDWENPDQYRQLFVWKASGKISGFCLIHFMPGDETLHLLKIVIKPKMRGSETSRNFWEALRKEFKALAPKVFLEVESSNERALNFYKKVGFVPLRLMKGYYSNGSDGLSMELTL